MFKIGLTGGIGSGKSFVAQIFSFLDIPIFYSDLSAKYLMSNNEALKLQLKELLGDKTYSEDGTLNKRFVAEKIFDDSKILDRVNAIVHPAVGKAADEWFKWQKAPYAIQESALIYEIGIDKHFDRIISVSAPKKLRISRISKRDNASDNEIESRMDKQWPQEEKDKLADYVILNNQKLSTLQQVINIHKELLII